MASLRKRVGKSAHTEDPVCQAFRKVFLLQIKADVRCAPQQLMVWAISGHPAAQHQDAFFLVFVRGFATARKVSTKSRADRTERAFFQGDDGDRAWLPWKING